MFSCSFALRHAATTGKVKPRIVRSLLDGLGEDTDWQTSEDLEAAFTDRLETDPWDEDEWQ